MKWLRALFGRRSTSEQPDPPEPPEGPAPQLLRATSLPEGDIGTFAWDPDHNRHMLKTSSDGLTVEWPPSDEDRKPCWVPVRTRLRLHSGCFRWDYVIDEMANRQIGVGFMLFWDAGVDWGFFGYLGASTTAWAYDPSTGDVVCNTKSIEGGLPKFAEGRSGTVSVELSLPRTAAGEGRFIVDSTRSRPIELPVGAVVLPAACLLKEAQRVRLAGFERL